MFYKCAILPLKIQTDRQSLPIFHDCRSYTGNKPDPPDADITYTKPYTRISTYLVGVVLGYIMFKLKGKKVKMHWVRI